jgi:hypothetical protein
MEHSQSPRNVWEQIAGPGVSRAETVLILLGAFGLALVALQQAIAQVPAWSLPQMMLVLVLALDLGGGVVTNAAPAAKRWYHRPGQGFWQHIGFTAAHLIHLVLVAWLFIADPFAWFTLSYGFLLVAALLILRAPAELRLPVAMLLWLAGALLGWYLLPPVAGLEWFLPTFYLKLLVCHLVP